MRVLRRCDLGGEARMRKSEGLSAMEPWGRRLTTVQTLSWLTESGNRLQDEKNQVSERLENEIRSRRLSPKEAEP
jgi:hypothetical protein